MSTIHWSVDANGDWSNTADWSPHRLPNSTDDVAINTADLHTVTHSTGADIVHTLTLGNDDFVVSGGSLTISSTSSFAKLLSVSGGSLELDGAATVASFSQANSTVSGTGTLAFGSGTQALDNGAILTIAQWSISGGAATSVNEILNYGGVFSQDVGTTLTISAADRLRLSGAASLAGAVVGAGTLTFAGGRQALNGANLTVANWVIGNGAVTSLNQDLIYEGAFFQAAGATLAAGKGDILSLYGASSLAGTVNGSGRVRLARATLDGLTLGGTAKLRDVAHVDQVGDVTIGDAGPAGTKLLIAFAATYSIENDSDIERGTSRASRIQNHSLLIKSSGAGTSKIEVRITTSWFVEAASGTLDLTRAIRGHGAMAVDSGATLKVRASSGANLTMFFNGGSAILALDKPSKFAATISGFAATDTIDLLKTKATAATLGAGDTLVIKNGAATIATFQLAGDYSGATFNVFSDGNGGTNVTVTNGPAHAAPIAGHQFIAAMAGFGGDSHGPMSVFSEAHYAHPPMLSAPRMAMA